MAEPRTNRGGKRAHKGIPRRGRVFYLNHIDARFIEERFFICHNGTGVPKCDDHVLHALCQQRIRGFMNIVHVHPLPVFPNGDAGQVGGLMLVG